MHGRFLRPEDFLLNLGDHRPWTKKAKGIQSISECRFPVMLDKPCFNIAMRRANSLLPVAESKTLAL
jgi:hypothetical protein